MIFYSKLTGSNNAAIGKLETPIKMIIEHESDKITKAGGIAESLFNIEKSRRFGETIIGESEFDVFHAAYEGSGAESDTITETYKKFIEHIQFMKEFTISAEMMEDAQYGVAADAKRRAESFTRAYYKTMNKICERALINGTAANMNFAGAEVDLTAPDGLPLFSASHSRGSSATVKSNQSNRFYGDIFSSGAAGSRVPSLTVFEEALTELSVKLRNMKDESGEALGYDVDTIILPGNRPVAESIAKKVAGTYAGLGAHSDINLHFGRFKVIVLPSWNTTSDCMMLMSSEANKNLGGNMFFNRVPLTVTNWVDNHTGNYIWNGRCRFGVGFGSYKHILLATDSPSAVSGATNL